MFGKHLVQDSNCDYWEVLIDSGSFYGFAPDEGEAMRLARLENGIVEVRTQSAHRVSLPPGLDRSRPLGDQSDDRTDFDGTDGVNEHNAGGSDTIGGAPAVDKLSVEGSVGATEEQAAKKAAEGKLDEATLAGVMGRPGSADLTEGDKKRLEAGPDATMVNDSQSAELKPGVSEDVEPGESLTATDGSSVTSDSDESQGSGDKPDGSKDLTKVLEVGISEAERIRRYLEVYPGSSNADVVSGLAVQGFTVSSSQVKRARTAK